MSSNLLYKEAVEVFGENRQLLKLSEECCEFIEAITLGIDKRTIEESADVIISMCSVCEILGFRGKPFDEIPYIPPSVPTNHHPLYKIGLLSRLSREVVVFASDDPRASSEFFIGRMRSVYEMIIESYFSTNKEHELLRMIEIKKERLRQRINQMKDEK